MKFGIFFFALVALMVSACGNNCPAGTVQYGSSCSYASPGAYSPYSTGSYYPYTGGSPYGTGYGYGSTYPYGYPH